MAGTTTCAITLKPLRRCHNSGLAIAALACSAVPTGRRPIPCASISASKMGVVSIVARWPRACSAAPSAMKGCTSPPLPMVGNKTRRDLREVGLTRLTFELRRQDDRRDGALHAVERANSIDDLIHFDDRCRHGNRDQVHFAANRLQQAHL